MAYGLLTMNLASCFEYDKQFSPNLFLLPQTPPWKGIFSFLNHKAFVPFAVSSSCIVHWSLLLYSDLPISVVFFSPIILFSCFLSPGLEMKASSHSAKFVLPLPILESKGISRPVSLLFPVFSGAQLCREGYKILHWTKRFLTVLPSTKVQSHTESFVWKRPLRSSSPLVIPHRMLPPRLSREWLGKANRALKALAGPAGWRLNMLRTLKWNNNYFQGVLGVAKHNSVNFSSHLRFIDFRGPAGDLHSQELLQQDTTKKL